VDWQKTGEIVRMSKSFVYVKLEGEVQEEESDAPYPMHVTNVREYQIGDKVLLRESVQRLDWITK
jgi:hypothetical protein